MDSPIDTYVGWGVSSEAVLVSLSGSLGLGSEVAFVAVEVGGAVVFCLAVGCWLVVGGWLVVDMHVVGSALCRGLFGVGGGVSFETVLVSLSWATRLLMCCAAWRRHHLAKLWGVFH